MDLSFRQLLNRYVCKTMVVYYRLCGYDIGENCRISRSAILDRAHHKGVHIGDNTRVLMEAMILAHDFYDYARSDNRQSCVCWWWIRCYS